MAINTLEELIDGVQDGVIEKGEYCDAIVDDVFALIYMVVQEERKSESALKRTLINLCENVDEINTQKNVSRQIATQVSLFLYDKLSGRDGFFETEGKPLKYAHNSLKEDDELFDVMKGLVNIFKDTRVFDKNSMGFSDLTYGQAILVQMFCYEMYKLDKIQKMLEIDPLLLRSELEIARRKILGIEIPESVFVKETPVVEDDIFEDNGKEFAAVRKAVAIENRKVSIPAEVYPDPVEDSDDSGIEFEEGFDVDALERESELVSPAEEYENNVSKGMEEASHREDIAVKAEKESLKAKPEVKTESDIDDSDFIEEDALAGEDDEVPEEIALNTVSFAPVDEKTKGKKGRKDKAGKTEKVIETKKVRDIESEFMDDEQDEVIDKAKDKSKDTKRKTFKPEIDVDREEPVEEEEEEIPNGVVAMLFPGLGLVGRIIVDIVVLAVLVVVVYIIATFLK